ncbi:MAG: hypothetical protein HC771_17660 [Synechococcales cyanobacterium CRU_2_2]|nr:hypothetical protein [Synechococcales cyanobacterium CRU_2_2]
MTAPGGEVSAIATPGPSVVRLQDASGLLRVSITLQDFRRSRHLRRSLKRPTRRMRDRGLNCSPVNPRPPKPARCGSMPMAQFRSFPAKSTSPRLREPVGR